MGQIVGGAAKPKRCNLNQLSQLGTPAAGEHILVSSDNSMNAAGQGNFDCYIEGDGQKAATALELKTIADTELIRDGKNTVTNGAVFEKFEDVALQLSDLSIVPLFPKTLDNTKVMSDKIYSDSNYVTYYIPVTDGYNFSLVAVFTAGYIRYGYTSAIPAVNTPIVAGYSSNGTGQSNKEKQYTSETNGYFAISFLKSAFTSITMRGENPHPGIGSEFSKFASRIDNELSKLDDFPLEIESISGVRVGEPCSSVNTDVAKYFPVKKGNTYKIVPVFTGDYIRRGFTIDIPASGVSSQSYTSNGTGVSGTVLTVVSPIDGYYAISFKAANFTSVSAAEVNPNKGLGIDVRELEGRVEELENLNAVKLALTGGNNPEYVTQGTIDIKPGKKYCVYIENWESPEIRYSYTKLKYEAINSSTSATRLICDYKGNQYFPNCIFFSAETGEDTLKVTCRITPSRIVEFFIKEVAEINVFDFNSYNDSLLRLYNMQKIVKTGGTTPFTLLHFSDIHADAVNMARITEYRKRFETLIDDIIHTGDMVASTVNATSFDFWDEVPNSAEILNVIGNHDIWYEDGFTHDANYPYVTYFKPYIDNSDWGTIVQPANAEANNLCYYYKDYAAKNIRLIVLDYFEYTASDVTWFENALADAKTKGYHVIVAIHYMPTLKEEFNTGFNIGTDYYSPLSGGVASGFASAVESFITNGGHFVCWLCGHEHRDYCGVAGTNTRQVVLSIDCAALRNDSTTRYRAVNTRSQDAFNLISVNTNTKTIQVFRVGNDRDALLRHIGVMCIDYENGTLLYTE